MTCFSTASAAGSQETTTEDLHRHVREFRDAAFAVLDLLYKLRGVIIATQFPQPALEVQMMNSLSILSVIELKVSEMYLPEREILGSIAGVVDDEDVIATLESLKRWADEEYEDCLPACIIAGIRAEIELRLAMNNMATSILILNLRRYVLV